MTVLTEGSPLLDLPGAVAIPDTEPDAGVAAHYGDPMREQRNLATAAGLVDRSNRGVLAVPGEDRLGWLHTLSTQYVEGLGTGQGTELLLLSPHGHIEHHAVAVDDGETLWLDTEPGAAGPLLDFLTSMRFLLRVEPRDATAEYAVASLVGPDAGRGLAALGVTAPEPPDVLPVPGPKFAAGTVPPRPTSRYGVAMLPGGGFVRRMPPFRLAGLAGPDSAAEVYDLILPRPQLAEVADRLRAAGVPTAGIWAYHALRVADRRPRYGFFETDHRTIPAEAGFQATAVHLDKGCYRGQETVARVHNLGRPPRRLVLLHLDGVEEELPAPGTPVLLAGRRSGFTGTAVRHHELGTVLLALVKRNVPADAVLTVGDSSATIDSA